MKLTSAPLEEVRRRHPSALKSSSDVRFAHPSEKVFAELLDLYGIAWVYEPVEFPLSWDDDGVAQTGFRPDFWLSDHQCFIELTTAEQRLVTKKNAKVRRCRELYPEVDISIVYQRDYLGLLERHGLGADISAA